VLAKIAPPGVRRMTPPGTGVVAKGSAA